MDTPVYGTESGKVVGRVEIPDEIIEAARRVAEWLRENDAIELCGLVLAEP